MKGAIASPHWEACDTCRNQRENGGCDCDKLDLNFSLHHLGDWIICEEYEEREDAEDD